MAFICKLLALLFVMTVSVSAYSIVPAVPGFTSHTISGPTIVISWAAVTSATSYQLERDGVIIYTGSSRTTNPVAEGAKTYAFRVKACNADGCSTWSAIYNVSTPTVPNAPTGVASSLSGAQIVLRWNHQYFVTSYEFLRNETPITLSSLGPTSAQDVTAVGAQNYIYKVRACINSSCSAWVATQISTFFTPVSPSALSATVSGSAVEFSWAPSALATRYEIQRSGNSTIWTATTNHYTDSSGVGSTVYTYSVRACIDTACSTWVTSNSVTTPPDVAPAAPASITPTITGSSIKVDWSVSSGATGYELQRSGSAGNIASGLFTTFTDSPTIGISYTYSVRSCKNAACSAWVTSSAVKIPFIPATPSFTSSSISGPTIVVNWSSVSGTTRYELERDGTVVYTGTATTTSIVSDGAKTYAHRIRACADDCSTWSAIYNVSTPSVPGTLTGFSASRSGAKIVLTWVPQHFVTSYEFLRDDSPITLSSVGTAAAQDVTVVGAKNYFYKIRSCINSNCSAWVGTGASTYFTPDVPTALSATVSGAAVQFSWAPSALATRYEIQRSGNSSIWTTTSTSYSDSSGVGSTAYTYSVRACIDTACSVWVTSSSVTTPPDVAPAAPANITAVVNGGNVDVSWSASANANGYYVERNEQALASVTGIAYQDAAPPSGIEYIYRVKACKYSACSAWVTATKIILLQAPVINYGQIGGPSSLVVTWGQVTGATRYEVEKDGSIISGANHTSTAYSDSNVNSGVTYSYRIRACSGSTCSNWSVDKSFPMMKSPTDVSVSLVVKDAALTWASMTAATSYKIYRDYSLIATVPASSGVMAYTDTLTATGSYYYQVSACKDTYCSVTAGPPVGPVVIQPAPLTPTGLSAQIVGSSIYLTWNTNLDATKYIVERNNNSLASNVTALGFTDDSPVPGMSYTYRVKACNANDLCSGWATTLLITMVGAPIAVDVSVLGSVIEITWNDVPGAAFYNVKRRRISLTNGDPYLQTNYVDTTAVPGTLYLYWVNGCNQYGCGAQTGSVEIGLPANTSSSSSSGSNISSSSASSNNSSSSVAGVVYEAESAQLSGAAIATNQSGYSGTGFVNYTATNGSIEWTVTQASAGKATLYFRYANGSGIDKPMSIYINNQLITTRNFVATPAWNAWGEDSIDVALLNGSNKVRLVPVVSSDVPLFDYLKVVNFVTTTTVFKYDKAGRLINVE